MTTGTTGELAIDTQPTPQRTSTPVVLVAGNPNSGKSTLFHLLLLLTVVGGLALRASGWELFAAPAAGAATQAYASTLAALPANAEILLALDVDGTVLDEMSPPLAETFDQLGRVAPDGRVLVASSSPVGAALIERSTPEEARIAIDPESPGYMTGGPAGQRAVLERSSADLMVVVAGESSGAQRYAAANPLQRLYLSASCWPRYVRYVRNTPLDGRRTGASCLRLQPMAACTATIRAMPVARPGSPPG